jgi:hypothetical protein
MAPTAGIALTTSTGTPRTSQPSIVTSSEPAWPTWWPAHGRACPHPTHQVELESFRSCA